MGSASATFASEAGAKFECSLDNAAYVPCASPEQYSNLADGDHVFRVRAADVTGAADPTPASRAWEVDTVPPAPPAVTGPANNSYDTDGKIAFKGTAEPGSTVRIYEGTALRGTTTAISNGAWARTLAGVANGKHTYTARATDRAGNVSAASAPRSIIVDKVAPRVLKTAPANGAAGIAPATNVTVTFSEPMKKGTINKHTFTLRRKGPRPTWPPRSLAPAPRARRWS